MNEASATLRPWMTLPTSRRSSQATRRRDITSSKNGLPGSTIANYVRADDADLIVRAVNAHDLAVEAMEAVVYEMDQCYLETEAGRLAFATAMIRVRSELLDAALAACREKP